MLSASDTAKELKPDLAMELKRFTSVEYQVTELSTTKFRELIKLGLVEKFPTKEFTTPFYKLSPKGVSVKSFLTN
jgi:hypothetical protein